MQVYEVSALHIIKYNTVHLSSQIKEHKVLLQLRMIYRPTEFNLSFIYQHYHSSVFNLKLIHTLPIHRERGVSPDPVHGWDC